MSKTILLLAVVMALAPAGALQLRQFVHRSTPNADCNPHFPRFCQFQF